MPPNLGRVHRLDNMYTASKKRLHSKKGADQVCMHCAVLSWKSKEVWRQSREITAAGEFIFAASNTNGMTGDKHSPMTIRIGKQNLVLVLDKDWYMPRMEPYDWR